MNILEILRNRYERNSTHPRCYTLRNFAKTTTKIHPRNESMKCVVETRGYFHEIRRDKIQCTEASVSNKTVASHVRVGYRAEIY